MMFSTKAEYGIHVMAHLARTDGAAPVSLGVRWALGSRRQLGRVWRGFAIQPQTDDLDHQARILLVDGRGFQRVGFPLAQATPERIAADYRTLAAEG